MIRITIDTSKLKAELTASIANLIDDKMTDLYVDLTASPPGGTPVDTGAARNAWQIDTSVPLHPSITNSSPYINRLNDGSSKQSPAGFIEAAIDKNFR